MVEKRFSAFQTLRSSLLADGNPAIRSLRFPESSALLGTITGQGGPPPTAATPHTDRSLHRALGQGHGLQLQPRWENPRRSCRLTKCSSAPSPATGLSVEVVHQRKRQLEEWLNEALQVIHLTAATPMDNPYCSCKLTRRCRAARATRRLHRSWTGPTQWRGRRSTSRTTSR